MAEYVATIEGEEGKESKSGSERLHARLTHTQPQLSRDSMYSITTPAADSFAKYDENRYIFFCLMSLQADFVILERNG